MRKVTWFIVLVCLLAAPAAWAQVTTGQIGGTINDASGAVVPNAKITVTNPATGLTRSSQSNETGNFALTLLPPGQYDLRVEAQGFAALEQKNISLLVGQSLTLTLTLKPGTITETITVTEEPPLIELTRSDINAAVSPVEVKELPIIDRNFAGLTLLIPGVRPAQGFDPTKSRVGNMSVGGGDGRQFDVNVDGGDNKDNVVGGMVMNFTLEGIQEFNVVTNRYTAESGRTVGGVVNVISKSGTNAFHGTLFGLFRNSTFDKIDHFQEIAGNPKPVFHRYHFGGSVGGAVIKDKLFFFGAYEHKREPGAIGVEPSAFRELSLFPLAQPVSQLPFAYTDHLLTVKLDWRISDKQSVYLRYGRQRWIQPNDQLGVPFTTDASQTNSDTNNFHDFVISHNYTVSPTKVNSFYVHFQDMVNAILAAPSRTFTLPVAGGGTATNPEIIFPGAEEIGQNVNVPQQTLIRKYQFRDDFSWTHGRHNMKFGANWIYLAKLGGFFFFGANGYQITFWDDPSVITSNRTRYPQGFATPGAVQSILFSGGNGNFAQRPHQLAFYFQDDFKVTSRLTLNLGLRWDANIGFLPKMLGSSLASTNRTIGILQQVAASTSTAPGAQAGIAFARAITANSGNLRRGTASWREFQPRVGFAWDPTGKGKLVIRGGYGIAFDQVFQNLTLFALQQANPTIYQTIIDLENTTPPPTPAGDLATFRFGVDPLPAPRPGLTNIETGAFGRINDPNMTDPYAQQWSLGGQWQFHPDYSFSVDYYHVLGIHEPRVQNINPRIRSICDPAYGGSTSNAQCLGSASTRFFDAAFQAAGLGAGRLGQTNMIGTTNRSRFDSVNFRLQKRMSHHFTFQSSYVLSWSNSWGGRPTASYSGNGVAITAENQFKRGEYGPTIFDERHRFVISGIFELPYGFEIAPLLQASSGRPLTFRAGRDVDGDGRTTIDRVCVGSTTTNFIRTNGCQQVSINSLTGEPFAQFDVRFAKLFKFHNERMSLRLIWELYNLTNRVNIGNNIENNSSASNFLQPLGYFGAQGFGPAFTGPFRSQFGFRFEW